MKKVRNRYVVLIMLTVVYGFNFIDRQILGILAPYIQKDLGFTDGQIGLLAGFAFAFFYTLVGLPLGWLADRYNRVNIVSVSLAIWSAFTALSGLAGSYWHMLLARMGVGIGEAGGSPPSHSIISDYFDANERARALAIYSLGIPFGIMSAYFISALLLGVEAFNWRSVFVILGIPGILFAVLLKLVVREPERGRTGASKPLLKAQQTSFGEALATLLKIPSYWGMCLGISFASFVAYGFSAFQIVYLMRTFPDVGVSKLLIYVGLISGVVYALGTFIGGMIADKWGERTPAGYALTPVVALVFMLPLFLLIFQMSSFKLALLYFAGYWFFAGFYLGPSFSMAQTLVPVSMRATSTAIFFFVLNIIALGGGPTAVGFLSESLTVEHGAAKGLGLALSYASPSLLLSIVAFLFASKYLPKDWARVND